MPRLFAITPQPTPVYVDHIAPDGTVVYLGSAQGWRPALRKPRRIAADTGIPLTEIKFRTEGEPS